MRFKVLAERSVLLHQALVRKRANEEESDQGAEDRKAATDPERPGVATVRGRPPKVCWTGIRTTNLPQRRGRYTPLMIAGKAARRPNFVSKSDGHMTHEHTPSARERADLANCGGGTIELATHSGRSRLGGKETKAVSGTKFTEAQKDTVNDSKSADVLLQLDVEATHDEANDCLQEQPSDLYIKNVTSKVGVQQETGSAPWCILDPSNRPQTLHQWFRACRINCRDLNDRSHGFFFLGLLDDGRPTENNAQ